MTVGGCLYVRSVRGPDAAWFRGAQLLGQGHIDSGGVSKDVTFTRVDTKNSEIDRAYSAKYGNGSAVRSITSAAALTHSLASNHGLIDSNQRLSLAALIGASAG